MYVTAYVSLAPCLSLQMACGPVGSESPPQGNYISLVMPASASRYLSSSAAALRSSTSIANPCTRASRSSWAKTDGNDEADRQANTNLEVKVVELHVVGRESPLESFLRTLLTFLHSSSSGSIGCFAGAGGGSERFNSTVKHA